MKRVKTLRQTAVAIGVTACATVLQASASLAQVPAELVGNAGIRFEVPTIIEFEFLESNGAYQSTFGVINLNTGEKTPLIAEAKPSDSFQDVNQPSRYTDNRGLDNRRDFIGTPGNTVPQPLAEFTFQPNTPYAFYLESTLQGQPAGTLYSTDVQNSNSIQQTVFEGTFTKLSQGGLVIRWDDTGSQLVRAEQQDRDFDDFIVILGGYEVCPFTQQAIQSY